MTVLSTFGARQRLRLCGHCAGCDAKTPTRGALAIVEPDMPIGDAAWICPLCAGALLGHPSLQRRIDLKLAAGLASDVHVVASGRAVNLSAPAWLADARVVILGCEGRA